jgi:hypothetical protein
LSYIWISFLLQAVAVVAFAHGLSEALSEYYRAL